jgi:TRAP-type C4-dicarboxylate transport system substrate-binding protein
MRFVQLGRVCALVAAMAVAATAAAAQTIELKLSHFVPPNHTFHKWRRRGPRGSPRSRVGA